jgi:putative oxidoreductase
VALQFSTALSASHFSAFFFAVQLVAGLLLLSGYFVPLALVLLAAEIFNILAFHLTMAPTTIGPGLLAAVLWAIIFLQHRHSFTEVLSAKPVSQG